jgi:NADPH-dependent ferric siderophore reductase
VTETRTRKRTLHTAEVVQTSWLTPSMVRVVLGGGDLAALPVPPHTDAYVKLLFPPAGASYRWPFDPDELRETTPRELWPVTRTYTIRAFDPRRAELVIDFVVHGSSGLAGPWAAAARPGDGLGFFGPGGGYAPDPGAAGHLLVGDEAALPAVAAALEALAAQQVAAPVEVFVEVPDAEHELPLTAPAGARIQWVHRGDEPYGVRVAAAVRAESRPVAGVQAFVHGNADLVRDLRRFLLLDRALERRGMSISGYWRTGYTEDRWQATKGEFNAAMEADEAGR